MFDLFRSRDKAVRFMLSGLLLLVALSMVTYLVPGSGGGPTRADNIVAEIGGHTVTLRDVQQALQNAGRNRQFPPEMMQHFAPQLVDQMITERAMVYQAEKMHFQVSDSDLYNATRGMMPQLFPEGKYVGDEALGRVLEQQGQTLSDFLDHIRRQILLNRLRSVVLEGTVVSNAEIEQEFNKRNEKAVVEYVKISNDKVKAEAAPSAEEIREYFNKNRAAYTVPPKRSFKLLVLDPAKVEASMTVSEQAVRRAYDDNKDQFRTPERVKARHILLKTTDKSKEEVAKIQTKAEELLKQVKAGGNFAELAKKNSEDTSSAVKGGDLDWVVRGQMVPEFESATFALKPGEISNLVKTQYGLHIIQVTEKEQARLKPFEEVKAELTNSVKKEQVSGRLQTGMDEAVAAVKKNPDQADQIAATMGLGVVKVEKVGAGDPIPELGVNRDFEEAIASLKKGEVSQPVQAPGNRLVAAVITDVLPTRPAELDDVQAAIRTSLQSEKSAKLVGQRAATMLEKVKSLNGDLKKAAQSMGLEVVTSKEFTRNGAIDGLGSAGSIPDLFSKPAGTLFGPVPVGDGQAIGKVVNRIPADLSQLAAQRDVIRDEIKSTKARDRNALFEDGVRRQLEKSGKLKVNQDLIKRVVQGYRG